MVFSQAGLPKPHKRTNLFQSAISRVHLFNLVWTDRHRGNRLVSIRREVKTFHHGRNQEPPTIDGVAFHGSESPFTFRRNTQAAGKKPRSRWIRGSMWRRLRRPANRLKV